MRPLVIDTSKSPEAIARTRPAVQRLLRANGARFAPDYRGAAVYVVINRNNGKFYVGATAKGVDLRWNAHKAAARKDTPGRFYTALRKHGPEAFDVVTFAQTYSSARALQIEESLIEGIRPEYNITKGGGGSKGYRWTEEAKQRMSQRLMGRTSPRKGVSLSPAERARVSLGAAEWWKKRKQDPAYMEALRAQRAETFVKRKLGWRAVVNIDTGEEFESLAQAGRHYGLRERIVQSICRYPEYATSNGRAYPRLAYKESK